jgi:hypothetical protein
VLVVSCLAAGAVVPGVWRAGASTSPQESAFVPVTPTRVLDTRDPVNIGLTGPFVSPGAQDLRITGVVPTPEGDRLVVPDGATSVMLNVTVVSPAAAGFVSVRPADVAGSPTTSSLNFRAGDIVPNAVTVALPTTGPDAGRIEIVYDAFGQGGPTTDILIDVVGYTSVAALTDLQARVDAAGAVDEAQQAQIDSLHNTLTFSSAGDQFENIGQADEVLRSITANIPANGHLVVTSAANVFDNDGDLVRCSIGLGTTIDTGYEQRFEGRPAPGSYGQLAGTRVFEVQQGFVLTVRLVCDTFTAGTATIEDSTLTALFTAG